MEKLAIEKKSEWSVKWDKTRIEKCPESNTFYKIRKCICQMSMRIGYELWHKQDSLAVGDQLFKVACKYSM
jgi:hypothetical protein